MDNNTGFGINNNLEQGNGFSPTQLEPNIYNSYYNHKPRKKPWGVIILLVVIAIGVIVFLWYKGFFTPIDRQAEYNRVYNEVCAASVKYANTKYASLKQNSGKIIYVTIGELSDANLVRAGLLNYLTDEIIPTTTDVRLEVLSSGDFTCHGYAWKNDDKVRPVVVLKGEPTITIAVGTNATDPGATATDDKDGDISDKIERSGTVNNSIPGTYKIIYQVIDRAGNLSLPVERTYIVK